VCPRQDSKPATIGLEGSRHPATGVDLSVFGYQLSGLGSTPAALLCGSSCPKPCPEILLSGAARPDRSRRRIDATLPCRSMRDHGRMRLLILGGTWFVGTPLRPRRCLQARMSPCSTAGDRAPSHPVCARSAVTGPARTTSGARWTQVLGTLWSIRPATFRLRCRPSRTPSAGRYVAEVCDAHASMRPTRSAAAPAPFHPGLARLALTTDIRPVRAEFLLAGSNSRTCISASPAPSRSLRSLPSAHRHDSPDRGYSAVFGVSWHRRLPSAPRRICNGPTAVCSGLGRVTN